MAGCTLSFDKFALAEGKVFATLQITGADASTSNIRISSTREDGTSIPTEMFSIDDGRLIVATIQLTQPQTLKAAVVDSKEVELASTVQLIDNDFAQGLPAQGDYADLSQRYAPFTVAASRIIMNIKGDEALVDVNVGAFPYRADHDEVPTLSIFGLDGTHVPIHQIDLGSASRADLRYPTARRYLSTVSFRIPNSLKAFVISAVLNGKTRNLVLSNAQVEDYKNRAIFDVLIATHDPRYHDWYLTRHKANDTDLYLQQLAVKNFAYKPTFSIIVPLYQTPLDFFNEMAESVLAQTYPHFELILVNASPENRKLNRAVEALCKRDPRVRHISLAGNKGITENTNEGIQKATGDFLAFLDHDDIIEPDLLYCYTKGINDYPTTDLLYCDEDHYENGIHRDPFFKPDWDPDLLCCENYVCHMLCVRKSIVDALPELPDSRFDGAQDHNLTFLVGEQARNVYHARRLMYHWRMHENSTSGKGATDRKSYALEAERLSVQNHLDRCGINATAVMGLRQRERIEVVYNITEHPLVSIVIPNKDAVHLLEPCVNSILEKSTWPNYEIVIAENNSTESETFACYERFSQADERVRTVTIDTDGTFNFSKVINEGFAAAKGDYLIMLNNDTQVIDGDWIEKMMGPCMRSEIGAVGCKLLYPDNTYQHVGVALGRTTFGPRHIDLGLLDDNSGYFECDELSHRVSAVTGACILTRRDVFEQVGGLDETLPSNFNDIDYCMRLRKAGYACLIVLSARLYHFESATRPMQVNTKNSTGVSRDYGIFMYRWQKYLTLGEPFYNMNFRGDNAYHALEL